MTLSKRLESLERQTPPEQPASAQRIYAALCSIGAEAPEPEPDMTSIEYLRTVPTPSLRALLDNQPRRHNPL